MVMQKVDQKYSLTERAKSMFGEKPMGVYVTNSLLEMEDYFAKNPPEKICSYMQKPVAIVFLFGLEIKLKNGIEADRINKKWGDVINRSDLVDELGGNKRDNFFAANLVNYAVNKILDLPAEVPFEIKQGAIIRPADWIQGRTENYDIASKKYAFNDIYYVNVPLVGLRYTQDNPLIIEWFDVGNKIQPKTAKNEERLEIFGGLPALGY
jgi:hypothetical protein